MTQIAILDFDKSRRCPLKISNEIIDSSPGDEPRNFYDHLTHLVEGSNPFFSEVRAISFGCKNQVEVRTKNETADKKLWLFNSTPIELTMA